MIGTVVMLTVLHILILYIPSLYLKSNINIISGNGSKSNPYKLN